MKSRLIETVVPPSAEQERLDVAVAKTGLLTRTSATRMIKDGRATVDNNTIKRPSHLVSPGNRIIIEITEHDTDKGIGRVPAIEPIYQDEHIVVYDKPAGIATHPGAGNASGTLSNALTARFPKALEVGEPERPGIVHRLDKNTSGLIVTALTAKSHTILSNLIKERRVKRMYTALVCGHPKQSTGIINAPIGRSPKQRIKQAVVEGGRVARTKYKVVRTLEGFSLLEVELDTGRMHQIRVHMLAIGHPIAGDLLYGTRKIGELERQFLHAGSLDFPHPISGKPLTFTAPLPDDLKDFLETIG